MDAVFVNFHFMISGIGQTVGLAGFSILFSAILGVLVGTLRSSTRWYVRYPARGYIELIRSVPLIIFILYIYFVLTDFGLNMNPFWAGVAALSIFTSAYVAETVRAGVAAVPPGQFEAARSSGFTHLGALRHVVLPQAIRRMVPAMVSEFVKLIKDTSLVSVIGAFEFFRRVQVTNSRVLTEPFALLGFAAVVYFVINFSLSRLARRLELRLDV
jgi:putative glutamine transport system permease protein